MKPLRPARSIASPEVAAQKAPVARAAREARIAAA